MQNINKEDQKYLNFFNNSKSYELKQKIGVGGFSNCFKVLEVESNQEKVIKIIDKKLLKGRHKQKVIADDQLLTQIKIHKMLKHPNIVKLQQMYEDQNKMFMILQLCQNKTLNQIQKSKISLKQIEIKKYIYQILIALQYLHQNKIAHREYHPLISIKPGNIFLTKNNQVKLGDFGLATFIQQNKKRKTICGTANYMAPQIIQGNGHSFEVDIWSLGILILFFGKCPFYSNDSKQTYKKIINGYYEFPETFQISEQAKRYIKSILINDPKQRASIKDLLNDNFLMQVFPRIKKKILMLSSKSFQNKELYIIQRNYRVKKNNRTILLIVRTQGNSLEYFFNKTQSNLISKHSNNKHVEFKSQKKHICILQNKIINDIYVEKWIIYTKYGLLYLLSNGIQGMNFNDGSKIVKNFNNQFVTFYNNKGQKSISKCQQCQNDKDLNKKIMILKELKYKSQVKSFKQEDYQIFIKRWIKSTNCIIFKMSNKLIQANFIDNSQLFIYYFKKSLMFINKNKVRKEYLLTSFLLKKDLEVFQKFNQIKNVLFGQIKKSFTKQHKKN